MCDVVRGWANNFSWERGKKKFSTQRERAKENFQPLSTSNQKKTSTPQRTPTQFQVPERREAELGQALPPSHGKRRLYIRYGQAPTPPPAQSWTRPRTQARTRFSRPPVSNPCPVWTGPRPEPRPRLGSLALQHCMMCSVARTGHAYPRSELRAGYGYVQNFFWTWRQGLVEGWLAQEFLFCAGGGCQCVMTCGAHRIPRKFAEGGMGGERRAYRKVYPPEPSPIFRYFHSTTSSASLVFERSNPDPCLKTKSPEKQFQSPRR